MGALLIAGPTALDSIPAGNNLLGGSGLYAAIAAAPLAPTQLWSRGGTSIDSQLQGILNQRHIDLSGVEWTGVTPRWDGTTFSANGSLLPEIEPTSADRVDGALILGLDIGETRRALRVIQALPDERTMVLAPWAEDLADARFRAEVCAAADLLILPMTAAKGDPLAAAAELRTAGAKAIAWCAGAMGGLLVYGDRATTWPTAPVRALDRTGVSAAFAGACAAWIAGSGRFDFTTCKRALWVGAGAGMECATGPGPKRLLGLSRDALVDRFNRLRRDHKC